MKKIKEVQIAKLRKDGFDSFPFYIVDGNNGTKLYLVSNSPCDTEARITPSEIRHIIRDANKEKLNKLLDQHGCVEVGRCTPKGSKFYSHNIFIRKP